MRGSDSFFNSIPRCLVDINKHHVMYSDDQKLGCLIYKVSVSASQIAGTGDVLRWHATRKHSMLIGALPTTTTQTVKVREGSNKCDV